MTAEGDHSAPFMWGWAGTPLEEPESGDRHVVVPLPDGLLVAVIDGLGHGVEAAVAAEAAEAVLRAHCLLPVQDLIERCHEGLRKTRGAVLSVASFDSRSSTIDWCGVGNVEAVLFHADPLLVPSREALTTRGGVVGYRLPQLKVSTIRVRAGDVLVLVTDGIDNDFTSSVELDREPQPLADFILARHAKSTDDALVFVARFGRGSP